MGKETFIITGNQTTNSNQYTGVSNNGLLPVSPYNIQYGRVIEVRSDRSIRYELIKDNVNVSAINSTTVATGDAYNFNPNFTRLPEVGELVPIIKGPSKRAGSENGEYDQIDYYMIGPISIQITPDDNKVPKNISQSKSNDVDNYKLNEVGVSKPTPGQVVPSSPNSGSSTKPTKGILMGDSLSPSIKANSKKLEPLTPSGVLWQSGIALNVLNQFVTVYPIDKTVTHVFITIGTNDRYVETTSIPKFINLVRTKFPSAKLYIIKGLYGYSGIVEGGVDYFGKRIVNLPKMINDFYKKWTDLGVTLLQNGVGQVSSHPGTNTPSVKIIGEEIDRILSNYK